MPEVNYLHSVSWGFLKVRCQVDFVIQNTMNMYLSDKASRYSSDEVRMMSLPDEGKARLVPEKPVDFVYLSCKERDKRVVGRSPPVLLVL